MMEVESRHVYVISGHFLPFFLQFFGLKLSQILISF